MIVFNKEKDTHLFFERVVKLTPEQFIALAKLLEVKMSTVDKESGKYEIRDAEDIALDCTDRFQKLPHKARKLILRAMEV